jgi:hypothetical protein
MQDNDFVSLMVDRIEDEERVANDREHPNFCFVGGVTDQRKSASNAASRSIRFTTAVAAVRLFS